MLVYFNHIGSRLSTETPVKIERRTPRGNFNHIGSRLSTETADRLGVVGRMEVFQPHRLTVEH